MTNRISMTLVLTALITLPVQAEVWQGEGVATFSVKATGHTVHGEVTLKPFEATVVKKRDDTLLSWANDAEIIRMGTGNKKRDVEMHHVLHADHQALIHGEVANLSVAALKAESAEPATFPVVFNMAGVEIEKEVTRVSCEETPEGLSLKVAFDVSQLEHGLKPIRKMGFLKVKDTVHVEVQFTLAP